MLLRTLLQSIQPVAVEGPVDLSITSLACDSRRVAPGALFVALPGMTVQGADYIPEAVDRGAVAVVCGREGFVSSRVSCVRVEDPRGACSRLASTFHHHPSRRLKVIGVTGTSGKTTVAFLVRHLLETAGIRTGLIGTVRYEIGDRVLPATRTTPEPLELHRMLAQMVRAGCQACVLEVSSHSLEQRRVDDVEFDVAIFTNLSHDHLDYHGTLEDYYRVKQRLFESLESGRKKGRAIINIDDGHGARLVEEGGIAVTMTYGLGRSATLRASRVLLGPDGTRLVVETPAGDLICQTPLVGRPNVYNTLAAVGAGLAMHVEPAALREGLAGMGEVPGRMESIRMGQPFAVYVDYAQTGEALRNALETMQEVTSGRLLVVFGCEGDRDRSRRAAMGRVASELAHYTVLTSDNPRRESATDILAEVLVGYREVRSDGYFIEPDRRRALESVLRIARTGDAVLIAGKGHEPYQELEDTVIPFDDRVHAREALSELGWPGAGRRARRALAEAV